jgi:tetratricopeptide (TPR) repeat protein
MSNYNHIENYLFGKMDVLEKTEFEAKINSDIALQEEVELHRLEHRGMQLLHENRLREKMKTWKKEETKVISIFTAQNFKYALAACLLVVGSIFAIQLYNTPNNVALAMDNFQNPSLANYRGTSGETKEIDAIAILVAQKQYDTALQRLSAIAPASFESQLLVATCYFHKKKFDEAEKCYRTLITSASKPIIAEDMEWNLVLTLLAKNGKDDNEFKQLLKKVLEDEKHSANKNAKNLKL